MRLGWALAFAALSLFVCTGFSLRAIAADAAGDDVSACIGQGGDFQTKGKVNSYVFTVENKCEKRLKCTIDAYVTGAKGSDSGHGTLIVAPKSQGEAAKKSFTMKVKEAGGTVQVSHDCKAL